MNAFQVFLSLTGIQNGDKAWFAYDCNLPVLNLPVLKTNSARPAHAIFVYSFICCCIDIIFVLRPKQTVLSSICFFCANSYEESPPNIYARACANACSLFFFFFQHYYFFSYSGMLHHDSFL